MVFKLAINNQIGLPEKQTTLLIQNNTTDKMLEVLIKPNRNIWIGSADVKYDNGFLVSAYETEKIQLPPSDGIYGYSLEGCRVYLLATEILLTAPVEPTV